MKTAKDVILTAIHFKGINLVESEAVQLAGSALCSVAYVKRIIAKVRKGEILVPQNEAN